MWFSKMTKNTFVLLFLFDIFHSILFYRKKCNLANLALRSYGWPYATVCYLHLLSTFSLLHLNALGN